MNKTCCFFGHRQIFDAHIVRDKLKNLIEQKINEGYSKFLMGTHGDFDKLALSVCRELRKIYSNIEIVVVVTSLAIFVRKKIYNSLKDFPEWERRFVTEEELEKSSSIADELYSDVQTFYYEIEEEHFKRKITTTNRFMIDDSNCVIGYINQNNHKSGAKTAFNYATRQGKETINIF